MHSKVALDVADRCSAGAPLDQCVDAFRQAIRLFGFDVAACGAWVGVGSHRSYRFFFVDWPQDYLTKYQNLRLFERDPVVLEVRRRMEPFLWSEVLSAWETRPDVRDLLEIVRAHGWVDGYVVPIHGPAGYQGVVSLAARAQLRLAPIELALVQLMATAIHQRCRLEIGYGSGPEALRDLKLSKREIECLRWAAVGKSDAAIGTCVGISTTTAHFHIENVKRKLGVASRVQAVALLVLRGEI